MIEKHYCATCGFQIYQNFWLGNYQWLHLANKKTGKVPHPHKAVHPNAV